MCESCQRPASNGIIVPRDSGPLTTSALEKSQKQTAQCKQEQPRAAVLGQSSQVRAPAAEAAPAAPGPLQAPSRPQHDPPRRSGTVGASLFPSSIARPPGPRRCSVSGQPCKGASRLSGNRSPLGCVPLHSAGAVSRRAARRELNAFRVLRARDCLGLSIWV